jgi:hypothetical protein
VRHALEYALHKAIKAGMPRKFYFHVPSNEAGARFGLSPGRYLLTAPVGGQWTVEPAVTSTLAPAKGELVLR